MSRTVVVSMVLLAMLLSVGVSFAQNNWYDRISLTGYAQGRYTFRDAGVNDFGLESIYLTVQAKPTENATVVFTVNRGGDSPSRTNIELYNAFVDYKINDQWAIQMGQVPTWFGWSGWRGSSERIEWERPRIIQGLPAGSAASPDGRTGFFVLGAPDRGIWVRRNPSGSEPLFIVGVSNGQFRDDDPNQSKNVDVHLKFRRPWGSFGASYLKGTFTAVAAKHPFWAAYDGIEEDRDALGLYFVLDPKPWGFQGEWAQGEMFGRDRDGYQLQAMYDTGKGIAYANWEEFNVDPSATVSVSDNYEGWTIGYAWQLDATNRITFQYTNADWTSGAVTTSETYGGVQWQFMYK